MWLSGCWGTRLVRPQGREAPMASSLPRPWVNTPGGTVDGHPPPGEGLSTCTCTERPAHQRPVRGPQCCRPGRGCVLPARTHLCCLELEERVCVGGVAGGFSEAVSWLCDQKAPPQPRCAVWLVCLVYYFF